MTSRTPYFAGEKHGRLTAVRSVGMKSSGKVLVRVWRYRCDCGSEVEVVPSKVRNGNTKSCGCLNREKRLISSLTHGEKANGRTSPEYLTWINIRQRCGNPNSEDFQNYGGRGISVCGHWRDSFANFLEDMGRRPSPEHSIDRIDNDGNYEPSNCRWATRIQQQRNKRSNHFVTVDGVKMTVVAAAQVVGITEGGIRRRARKSSEVGGPRT